MIDNSKSSTTLRLVSVPWVTVPAVQSFGISLAAEPFAWMYHMLCFCG